MGKKGSRKPKLEKRKLSVAKKKGFYDEELNQLRELEKEAKVLKKQLKSEKIVFPVVRPQVHNVNPHLFVEQEKEFHVPELDRLKQTEREIRFLKKGTKEKVVVVGPTSRMFGKEELFVKSSRLEVNPSGIFKSILELEEKVESKEYADALELYLDLNRELQESKTLSPPERKEAFNRLLTAYKGIRERFFTP